MNKDLNDEMGLRLDDVLVRLQRLVRDLLHAWRGYAISLAAVAMLSIAILPMRGSLGVIDKIQTLGLGSDDYLTKPFSVQELLARIRAVMRRTSGTSNRAISVGAITIDLVWHVVKRDGEEIHLTPTEFDLLRVLATNLGRVLTHRQLLERVWGGYAAENAQQLRVYISYLRRKREADPASPTLIVTEPGIGYRLCP